MKGMARKVLNQNDSDEDVEKTCEQRVWKQIEKYRQMATKKSGATDDVK